MRPKHRNGTQTPKQQDKHRSGTERRLYIHYSDIFVNSHAILGYIMLEMLKQNFETKFDIPNFLCFIHMYTAYKVVSMCKNCNFLYRVTTELTTGVGQGAQAPPPLSKVRGWGHKWVCAPPPPYTHTFGQRKCSKFTILGSPFCSYFVVKNTFFFLNSWLASSSTLIIYQYFPNFTNLKF